VKLIVLHQLLVYADGSVHTTKTNTDALLLASKEFGLEVNADKTKYSETCQVDRLHKVTTY